MKAERTDSEPRVAQLEAANARLQAANARLQAENAQLRAENAQLRAAETRWQAQQEELRRQLQAWQEQVQELQRRLGLDSSNSGKPPSSDGPAKPPAARRTRSQRGRSGKRSGGQPGHKGTTLSQTDTPDQVQAHWPSGCSRCGEALSAADVEGEPQRRQVYDLPEPVPAVSEHPAAPRSLSCPT